MATGGVLAELLFIVACFGEFLVEGVSNSSSTITSSTTTSSTLYFRSSKSGNASIYSVETPPPVTPKPGVSAGGVVGIVAASFAVVTIIIFIILYFVRKRSPILCNGSCFKKRGRSSTERSFLAKELEDTQSVDERPMESTHIEIVTDEPTDDYFYDEVFERSAFVDPATNRSLKQLYSISDEPDTTELPDLLFKYTNRS